MKKGKTNLELALFSIALLIVIFAFALSPAEENQATANVVKITGMQTVGPDTTLWQTESGLMFYEHGEDRQLYTYSYGTTPSVIEDTYFSDLTFSEGFYYLHGERVADTTFTLAEADSWMGVGLTSLDEAREWRDVVSTPAIARNWWEAGLTNLDDVMAWRAADFRSSADAGNWRDANFIDPTIAREWRDLGFPPHLARDWRGNEFSPEEAINWADADFSYDEARDWRAVAFSPEQAQGLRGVGLSIGDSVMGFPPDMPYEEKKKKIEDLLEFLDSMSPGHSRRYSDLMWRKGDDMRLYLSSQENPNLWRTVGDDNLYMVGEDGSVTLLEPLLVQDIQVGWTSEDGRNFDLEGNPITTPAEEAQQPTPYEQELQRATELMQDNKLGEAREIFERLLEEDPSSVGVLTNLGIIHFLEGNFEEARRLFEQAPDSEISKVFLDGMDKFPDDEEEARDYVMEELEAQFGPTAQPTVPGITQPQDVEPLDHFSTEDPDHTYRYNSLNDKVEKLDENGFVVATYAIRDDGTWYWDKDGVNKGDMSDEFDEVANRARAKAQERQPPITPTPPITEEPETITLPSPPDEIRQELPEDIRDDFTLSIGLVWEGENDEGNILRIERTEDGGWSYTETETRDGLETRRVTMKFDNNRRPTYQETADFDFNSDGMPTEGSRVITNYDENGDIETKVEKREFYEYATVDGGEIVLYTISEFIYDADGVAIGYIITTEELDEHGFPVQTIKQAGKNAEGEDLGPDEEGILENINKGWDFSLENIWYGLETAARGGVGRFFSLFMKDDELREWQEKVDKFFCDTILLGGKDCWTSKICEKDIPKTSRGFAYMDIPGLTTREAVFVLGERSKLVYDINQTESATEYLYKLNYKVENPTDGDIYFNVYLSDGRTTIPIYEEDRKLEKKGTYSRVGMTANVKYSSYFYNKICVKFDRKIRFAGKTETDEVCNEITKTTEMEETRYTPPTGEGEEEEPEEIEETDW